MDNGPSSGSCGTGALGGKWCCPYRALEERGAFGHNFGSPIITAGVPPSQTGVQRPALWVPGTAANHVVEQQSDARPKSLARRTIPLLRAHEPVWTRKTRLLGIARHGRSFPPSHAGRDASAPVRGDWGGFRRCCWRNMTTPNPETYASYRACDFLDQRSEKLNPSPSDRSSRHDRAGGVRC